VPHLDRAGVARSIEPELPKGLTLRRNHLRRNHLRSDQVAPRSACAAVNLLIKPRGIAKTFSRRLTAFVGTDATSHALEPRKHSVTHGATPGVARDSTQRRATTAVLAGLRDSTTDESRRCSAMEWVLQHPNIRKGTECNLLSKSRRSAKCGH
jgi:hypothetical protein